jgi:hypothetical protein
MPVGLTNPAPSDAPVGQQKKGTAAATTLIPFARSSKWHVEQGDTRSGIAINVAAPGTFNFPIPSYGFLSAVLLTVQASGGSGVAAVAYEDAPWSMIQSLVLQDVNGVPIWQLSGYHGYLASKFGGYRLFGPDVSAQTSVYQPVQTNGNFKYILPIYLEFGNDGLGCLPNMDASARYNLQVILASGTAAATGPVYTTAPTGYPTLSMQVEVLCRSQPPAVDMFGNRNSITPPAVGTIQYWTLQTFTALTGAQTLQLTRVGNLIRNHILVFRDTANGTRATAESTDIPLSAEFDWDSGVRYISNTATQRQLQFLSQGYDNPNGVVFYSNTLDPDKLAFSEYGDEWMATMGATKLTLRFTPQASCGLSVLTNDIVPASSQIYSAPALVTG